MKIKSLVFVLFLALPFLTFAEPDNTLIETSADSLSAIQEDLAALANDWNQGDLKAVVNHYKKANSTLLISFDTVRGYKNIAAFFRKHYSSKKEMGTAALSQVEINLLSPRYAMVTGNWLIKHAKGNTLNGTFSLLYENTLQGWKIALDHISFL